ncbi:MAG: DNA packaging protein [Mesorhizobium sp.]|nr:MAG: DNA packaging protein [Mesorhizobium sp.]
MDFEALRALDPVAAALVGEIPQRDTPRQVIVNAAKLADLIDLSEARVVALARSGAIPRVSAGRYDQREAVRAYIRYVRANPLGRKSNDPALADERRRLVREQADREAHRNAVARGELVAAADVKAAWESILTDVRAAMLAIPSRVPELDRATVERLDREIRTALEALANG